MQIGPNVYAYVRQNPWTAFDPDGLLGERAENAHHKTPYSRIRKELEGKNWSDDVAKLLNGEHIEINGQKTKLPESLIALQGPHGYEAHGQYNVRVNALIDDYISSSKIKPSATGKDALAFAKGLIAEIDNTPDGYIRGFNTRVEFGYSKEAIQKWGHEYKQGVFSGSINDVWHKADGTATGKGGGLVAKTTGALRRLIRFGGAALGAIALTENIHAHGVVKGVGQTMIDNTPPMMIHDMIVKPGAEKAEQTLDRIIHPRDNPNAQYNLLRRMREEIDAENGDL